MTKSYFLLRLLTNKKTLTETSCMIYTSWDSYLNMLYVTWKIVLFVACFLNNFTLIGKSLKRLILSLLTKHSLKYFFLFLKLIALRRVMINHTKSVMFAVFKGFFLFFLLFFYRVHIFEITVSCGRKQLSL